MTGAYKGSNYQKQYENRKIITADGERLNIMGTSNLQLSTAPPLQLSNVLVPKLVTNLISVGQLVNEGKE